MKIINHISLVFLLSYHLIYTSPRCAITYNFSGGRFGDNLIAYLHARYIAYLYDVPFLYKPFDYSNELALDTLETKYDEKKVKKIFNRRVTFKHNDTISINKDEPILYIISYFPECLEECKVINFFHFKTDWNNPGFKKLLQPLIKPKKKLKTAKPPRNKISIAVHVRKGGGVDNPLLSEQPLHITGSENDSHKYFDVGYPLKVPPDSYYIEQLQWISNYFNHQSLYVYIFTDDRNPQRLVQLYKQAVNLPNIEFVCRTRGNHHAQNVLEDFFSMTKFNCLIRSTSNYALSNSCIFDYDIVISPASYAWKNGRIYIDAVARIIQTKE